jgi:drug/metabolite transporter (DMT)-like permease
MTEVVVGVGTAAMFSGDRFGWREAVGMVLILAAGVVEVLGRAPPPLEGARDGG